MPEFINVAQALTVMMSTMTEWQERMISMAGALSNAAEVSGARGFFHYFAVDASRMHRRFARITVQEGVDAHDVDEPIPATVPAVVHVPVAPAVAANVPVPVVPVPAYVTTPVPVVPPATAVLVPAALTPRAIPIIASAPTVAAVTPVATPVVAVAVDVVPAHVLPPAATHMNPSPVALADTTRTVMSAGTASGSTAHKVTHAMRGSTTRYA